MQIINAAHELNRRHWDCAALEWKRLRDNDGLWSRCPGEPDLAFEGGALDLIRQAMGNDLAGKQVCLIGSGDNYAAFALAGLGARVTSTDISQAQLDVAAGRARQLGLDISFIQADAADLHALEDSHFDLVCSTNGFFVWIADLRGVLEEVFRLLRPGGCYVFYDIHPFLRPWKDQNSSLEMAKPYWKTGPFEDAEDGSVEFNWTLADLLNPLAQSGLVLRHILESPARDARFWQGHSYKPGTDDRLLDWRENPRAGLPVWLAVAAQKPPGGSNHRVTTWSKACRLYWPSTGLRPIRTEI
ncbi:MAG: class I SAM-dependent methyltransferase [Anaerolineae bacterium]|nr:class I SAM-dependent methyltransferase [Anaerolineae bacterium]